MAVINANRVWTKFVPYLVNKGVDARFRNVIETSIAHINTSAGIRILVPLKGSDMDFLDISSGHEKSESIGYQRGPIIVKATSKRSLIHEILHALGFCHEQLHPNFAWCIARGQEREAIENPGAFLKKSDWNRRLAEKIDDHVKGQRQEIKRPERKLPFERQPQPETKHSRQRRGTGGTAPRPYPRTTLARSDSGGAVPRPSPRSRPREIKRTPAQDAFARSPTGKKYLKAAKKQEVGAVTQFRSYLECLSDPNLIVSPDCDYDSIMMYDPLARAAWETQQALTPPRSLRQRVSERRLRGDDRDLSQGDIAAIRLYIVPSIRGRLELKGMEHRRFRRSDPRFQHKTITIGPDKNGKF
jgi:hypothetical protein